MTRASRAFLRVLGPLVAAAGLILASVPAFAQTATTTSSAATGCSDVHFELANPAPGAMLEPGGLVIEGIAMDTRATSGSGIDRIDFFLGNRDEGGMSVGTAIPGATAGPFGNGSFHTVITLPNISGGGDLFGYAHSTVSNQESVVAVPVAIGQDPAVAGETSANGAVPSIMLSCQGTAQTTTTPPSTEVTTPATITTPSTTITTTPSTTTPTTTTPSSSTVTFEVANPAPGATILAGAYSIEGMAFDKSATQGMGIDRIDVFLDNRDAGGTFLGTAALGMNNPTQTADSQFANSGFRLIVNLPRNQRGLHTLQFIAHSSVGGGETMMEVPVTIE
ncbi:MAG TPA: hypothetical protein VGL99_14445 [Chloroflexota bacterium]|jgi:hypothetical protein